MHANVSDDVSDPQDGQAMRVLRHALRPHPNSSCHVHCVSTDELDELRAEAAHQLYQRDLQTQTSSSYSSSSATSHSAGEAAAAATGRTVGATRTFVLQIGA